MGREVQGSGSTGGICPICGKSADAGYRPFCSRRCADVDLWRWLKGTYAIPGGQADADEDGDDALAAPVAADEKRESPYENE